MDKPVTLKGSGITIGRGPGMDIRLTSPKVSSRHARLERDQGGWVLRDMGSANGTTVNGLGAAPGAGPSWRLQDGDVLQLADTNCLFRGDRLWVPADALVSGNLAASVGRSGVPPVAWLGAGVVLFFMLTRGSIAEPPKGGGSRWATEAAGAATLTAAAPTLPPPPTDTPGPIPTRSAILRLRPTATPAPTNGGPTATRAATLPSPSGTPIRLLTDTPVPGQLLVLANYFAWYDNWDLCNVSAGDRPSTPYRSDDAGAIRRQVVQASGAGIDGFTLHWIGPGERTDDNFRRLLDASRGTAFRSTVVVEQHFFQGKRSVEEVATALTYVMEHYAGNANFLRYGGRPVLFFVDMDRIAGNGGNRSGAMAAWSEVRRRVDPRREAIWIAEGDNSAMPYLDVFDGLYTYRIVHRGMPNAYQKLPRYAEQVRVKSSQVGRRLLWVATIMPGWDDERSACMADVRVPAPRFKRDREGGDFYRASFEAALATAPDILYVNSFNEWVEGHYIEPSSHYGDQYLTMTREFTSRYKHTN